jgi:hypothetical protein
VEVFFYQMLIGEMQSLGFGWRRLGPRLLHFTDKRTLPFHDIMGAVSCRAKPEKRAASSYLRADKLARLEDTGVLNREYSVATFFSSSCRGD